MVSDDRAQLMLVGAIIIALVIVSIVVMLNGLHFTEHVGSETSIHEMRSAKATHEELRRGLEDVFYEVDKTHSIGGPGNPDVVDRNPYATEDHLRQEAAVYARLSSNMSIATRGVYANLTVFGAAEGSRTGVVVYQAKESDFRSADGESSWTVVEGANSIPVVELHIEAMGSSPFTLEVSDGSNTWKLTVEATAAPSRKVSVSPSSSPSRTCSFDGDFSGGNHLTITITGGNGRVTNETGTRHACGFELGPDLPDGAGATYAVKFVDGNQVSSGTFAVSAGGGRVGQSSNVDDTSANSPSAYGDNEPTGGGTVIVNPKYSVTYQGHDVNYTVNRTLYAEAP